METSCPPEISSLNSGCTIQRAPGEEHLRLVLCCAVAVSVMSVTTEVGLCNPLIICASESWSWVRHMPLVFIWITNVAKLISCTIDHQVFFIFYLFNHQYCYYQEKTFFDICMWWNYLTENEELCLMCLGRDLTVFFFLNRNIKLFETRNEISCLGFVAPRWWGAFQTHTLINLS